MMKRLFLIAGIFGLMMSPAQAQSDFVLPACDLVDEETLYWETIGEDVTLRIELKGESGALPWGITYLTFQDGEEVILGEGGKYIDDFTADNVPTCEDHLRVAKDPVLTSIRQSSPTYIWGVPLKSMSDVEKALELSKTCQEDDPQLTPMIDCRDILQFAKDFQSQNEIDPEVYKNLIDQIAPIIQVPYSTYGVDIYAYDQTARKFHKISYSGC